MTTTVETADELRARAAGLDERVEAMREEARALACQAAAYRAQARDIEAQEAKTRIDPLSRLNGHRELGEMLVEILDACDEPQPISALVEVLGEDGNTLRPVLERLAELGVVVRTGLKRGTRYRLAREGEEVDATIPQGQRYETAVRDAARELGTFTLAELHAKVPDISDQTVTRWLRAWTEQGVLDVAKVGTTNVYAYVKPDGPQPTRAPRSDPKPWERPKDAPPIPQRGQAVEGAGRSRKFGTHKELNKLAREAAQFGVEVKRAGGGHLRWILPDGRWVQSSSTPSGNSMVITRKNLRDLGVPVAP
jgi:DNA-binding transcriptional ArsR family regulator